MSVEYKLFVLGHAGYKNNVMLEELNKLGAEGWIMVGGTLQEHDYNVGWTAIFYNANQASESQKGAQQLKTEIAAYATDLQCYINTFGDDKKLLDLIVHGMRQLSAV